MKEKRIKFKVDRESGMKGPVTLRVVLSDDPYGKEGIPVGSSVTQRVSELLNPFLERPEVGW